MPDYPDLSPVSQDPNQPLPDVAPDSELVPYRIGRKDPGGEYQYTVGYAPRGRPAIAPPVGMGLSGGGVPDLSPLITEAFQRLPVDEAMKAVDMASRYIGQRGYMKDLENGANAAQAFAKWGPMLFRQATGLPEAINRTVPTPLSEMQQYQIRRNAPLDAALIAERTARAKAVGQITPYQQARLELDRAKAEAAKNKPEKLDEVQRGFLKADQKRLETLETQLNGMVESKGVFGIGDNRKQLEDLRNQAAELRRKIETQYSPAARPQVQPNPTSPPPPPAATEPVPFKEGAIVRSKKDGKIYKIIRGTPVLVKD